MPHPLKTFKAVRSRLSEVTTAVATRQWDRALLLEAGSDGTANPGDALVGAVLVGVGHEGAGLPEGADAALEGTAVLAVGPGAGDDDAGVARVDGAADEVALGGGPAARVVDLEGGAELGGQLAEVKGPADGDAVGDGVGLGDGDVDALAADADDDGGHLHVPVDEALLLVDDELVVVVAGALVEREVRVVDGDLGETLAGLDVVVVDLGGLGRDALNVEEELPGRFGDDGSYTANCKVSTSRCHISLEVNSLRPPAPKTINSPLRRSRSAVSVMFRPASLSSIMGVGTALTAATKPERRVIRRRETMLGYKDRRCQAGEE